MDRHAQLICTPRKSNCEAVSHPALLTSFEWHYAGAQTIALCKEAVSGWAQYSMQGRQTALGAAKQAMDSADTCHKELMAVFKTHS